MSSDAACRRARWPAAGPAEVPEHEADLRAVSRAIRRLRRAVIEVVHVGLVLPLLRLEARPRPRVPREGRLAKDVLHRGQRLRIRRVRIRGEQRIRLSAVTLFDQRFEVGLGHGRAHEQSALIGVGADEHRRVDEFPGLVQLVLIPRQHDAIEHRPEAAGKSGPCAFWSTSALSARADFEIVRAELAQKRLARRLQPLSTAAHARRLRSRYFAGPKLPPLSGDDALEQSLRLR